MPVGPPGAVRDLLNVDRPYLKAPKPHQLAAALHLSPIPHSPFLTVIIYSLTSAPCYLSSVF